MAPKAKPANLKQEIALAKQREVEVRAVFQKYDVDGSETIEMDELTALLEDLGLLDKLKTSPVEFAAKMFNEYDKDDNGVLSFEEFKPVYNAAKDDAAGKVRPAKPGFNKLPKDYKEPDALDGDVEAARKKAAHDSAMKKAEEAEKRRKENAEMKAKLAAQKGGDAKGLDDDMKRRRRELFEAKKKKKAEEAARIKAENAAMKAKLKNTKAATDNDVTDDAAGAARVEAAAASKARKAAEAAQLAQENAAMRDKIANTGAATDNDITDDNTAASNARTVK
jgi:hypothetical protein